MTLLNDVKYGLRMMAKSPVVTAVAVLSLALGVDAARSLESSMIYDVEPALGRGFRDAEGVEGAGHVVVEHRGVI